MIPLSTVGLRRGNIREGDTYCRIHMRATSESYLMQSHLRYSCHTHMAQESGFIFQNSNPTEMNIQFNNNINNHRPHVKIY